MLHWPSQYDGHPWIFGISLWLSVLPVLRGFLPIPITYDPLVVETFITRDKVWLPDNWVSVHLVRNSDFSVLYGVFHKLGRKHS